MPPRSFGKEMVKILQMIDMTLTPEIAQMANGQGCPTARELDAL